MPFGDHFYRSSDGELTLYARDYASSGPAVLLMHGLTRNSADFEGLASALGGQYRLIVPDQRGRGRSQWDADPARYRPDIYAQDMLALLDSLQIDRVAAIGTSMGGIIAMLMASTQRERLSALVLNDVGPEVSAEGLSRISSYVGETGPFASWAEAAEACRRQNAVALPDYSDAQWRAFAQRLCTQRPDGSIAFAYDPAIAKPLANGESTDAPDLWPLWSALDGLPILTVRGSSSDILSAETARRMGAEHSGPFELAEIAGRGHAPMLDEPAATRAITGFLKKYAQSAHPAHA